MVRTNSAVGTSLQDWSETNAGLSYRQATPTASLSQRWSCFYGDFLARFYPQSAGAKHLHLFGESFLYFYRNRRRFTDWQAVVIYPTRSMEQTETYPYRSQLNSDQVHRVYLDELGDINQLPLGVALIALTTVKEAQVPEVARMLLARSQAETEETRRGIIEMITTIVVYKFTNLSRQEAEAMLGITNLQETRFYQEAKEDGLAEGRTEEGRTEEGRSLTLRQLTRRFGELPQPLIAQIETLSLPQIETLAEALLDFQSIVDLEEWLMSV